MSKLGRAWLNSIRCWILQAVGRITSKFVGKGNKSQDGDRGEETSALERITLTGKGMDEF